MSNTNNRPRYTAFVKIDVKDKPVLWQSVGVAFDIKDGKGLAIKLNALPTDGQIFLFEPKSQSES